MPILPLLEKQYFINAGKDGTFADSGQVHTTPADVDDIFTYLNDKDIEKLVIYFHGGLVSESSGMTEAALMKTTFAAPADKRHVVSFVWETGPLETIAQNVDQLRNLAGKELFNEALKFVIKLVAKRLGLQDAKGGGGVYLSDETIQVEKKSVVPFENLDKVVNAKGGGFPELETPRDEAVLKANLAIESKGLIEGEGSEELKNASAPEAGDQAGAKGFISIAITIGEIAFSVLKRYYNKTHHDFYPTIMEEAFKKLSLGTIGTWGWGAMKTKAEAMFADNTGLAGDDLHAGTYFMDALNKHYASRTAAGKTFDIDLIGHSAGSIVICSLLAATTTNFTGLKYKNIFFLAPACRTDYFLAKGKPAIDAGFVDKFKMFTMKEENEKKDHCIPFIYTHSLLYMVSGLFENPDVDAKIMGLHEQFKADGRYAAFPELVALKAFIDANKLVLSDDKTNPDLSMRSNSFKHGDFDNDVFTLTSILNSI